MGPLPLVSCPHSFVSRDARPHIFMSSPKEYSLDWGGRKLTLSFPNWAEQANGSALVRYGDTVVLATAVMSQKPRAGMNFFPLYVDYQEKFYAAGRIRGSRFVKREGRPSDEATLVARMIDRSLRPRFDHRMRHDVIVVCSVLSLDPQNDADIPAFIAASAALHVSDIPWDGPVAAVRVGRMENKWILNPTTDIVPKTDMEVIVAGTAQVVNMLEAGANEASEDSMAQAIEFGHQAVQQLVAIQEQARKDIGAKKRTIPLLEPDEALREEIRILTESKLKQALFQEFKQERMDAVNVLKQEIAETLASKYPQDPFRVETGMELFEKEIDRIVHEEALKGRRVDGRKPEELRDITTQVALLPRTHGSAMFMRGLTHVLSTCTLAGPGSAQIMEEMGGEYKKYFMHHYNFPGFSVGDTNPPRGPGRREIGHGALAERALEPVLPKLEDFSYAIRVVSETLSSNGSSSMGSACAGSLALMDAGVPIKAPVAGIAIGLMLGPGGTFQVLTDIQGPEDHHGDMDFKVAGTRQGITGIQMDVKIEGVTMEMLREALRHGAAARNKILDVMEETLARPREELSPHAPLVQTIKINPAKIGVVIGPGGKMINEIIADTHTEINVEDDGTIFVSGTDHTGVRRALARIDSLTHEVKIGEFFMAKVVKITDFGAFVEYLPGQEGLVHVSEIAATYVQNAADIVKVGDVIPAKVIRVDDHGKVALSRKQALKDHPRAPET